MLRKIEKPSTSEYPAYAEMYMKWVPTDGNLLVHLRNNFVEAKKLVMSLSEQQLLHRYAPNKWTIKEVLVHIIDDERIYAYRAMCFARNEQGALPGFEQDDYVRYSGANERDISNIMEEYEAVRNATITLFNGFSNEALLRIGEANNHRASVRALGYHLTGHECHHMELIKEKYLL